MDVCTIRKEKGVNAKFSVITVHAVNANISVSSALTHFWHRNCAFSHLDVSVLKLLCSRTDFIRAFSFRRVAFELDQFSLENLENRTPFLLFHSCLDISSPNSSIWVT